MKPMTNVDVYTISHELNDLLTGTRVDKSYQPTKDTVVMKFHKPGTGRIDLVMQAGIRTHTTQYPIENPIQPPAFPMLLRKRLKGANIVSIKQHNFDRVIIITLKKEQEYKLIIELFDKGNIILLDEENNIIAPLKRKRTNERDISSKKEYEFPPENGINPMEINLLEFNDLIRYSTTDIVRTLASNGLGGLYAEEIIPKNIDKNTPCAELDNDDVEKIYKNLEKTFKPLKENNFKPQISKEKDTEKKYLTPISLKKYEQYEKTYYETFNQAADEYYSKDINQQITNQKEKIWNKKVGKYEKRLKLQEETLQEFHETIKSCQHKGELIYTYYNQIEKIIQTIHNAREKDYSYKEINKTLKKAKKEGIKDLEIFEALNNMGHLTININDTRINLDNQLSINENAEIYYEKSKKSKRKIKGAQIAIENTKKQLKEMEEKKSIEMEKITTPQKRIKKELKWYEKLRWFLTSDNTLVIGGRDANSNETVVKKYLNNNDMYFHSDIHGASSIAVKLEGKELTEQTIKETGEFTASYSSAWQMGYSTQDVYYVKPDQVSKTPQSGEFLTKGSFVIRGHKNYIRNAKLELAVGIVDYEGKRIMAGPIESLAAHTDKFVAVKPGHIKKEAIAKKIKHTLNSEEIDIDDIVRVLPSGKCDIINENEIKYRLQRK